MTRKKKKHPGGDPHPTHAQQLTGTYPSGFERKFVCEQCKKLRPFQDFFEGQPSYKASDRPAMCNSCGRRGRSLPKIVNEADTLTVAHRKAMRVMMRPQKNSDEEASKASGLSKKKCSELRRGKITPEFRRVLHNWMHSEGLTPEYLVSELLEATQATRRQWNPKEECWDDMPDNSVRFQAIRHAMKLLELEKPREDPRAAQGGVQIIMLETNLGKAEVAVGEGSYPVKPPVIDVEAEETG